MPKRQKGDNSTVGGERNEGGCVWLDRVPDRYPGCVAEGGENDIENGTDVGPGFRDVKRPGGGGGGGATGFYPQSISLKKEEKQYA